MGSRSPQAVKEEISQLRSRLDDSITELERRLPPLLRTGKAVAVALGGGAGGGALWWVVRRLRPRKKPALQAAAQAAPVVVNVLPSAALPIGLAVAAIWAGVRIFEARMRTQSREPGQSLRSVPGVRSA